MFRIFRIVFNDIAKNKVILFFIAALAILSWASFLIEDNVYKGLLTVMNVILMAVPLLSLLFSTVYVHNFREFSVLLLSQPIARTTLWNGLYAGVAAALCTAFLLGVGIPLLVYAFNPLGLSMLLIGLALTLFFVSLAFLICSYVSDKARGLGAALILWLFLTVIYDGILLFALFQLSDYPIENTMVALLLFNPVDLARLQILMQLDVSAIMGYAGAVFKNFLGQQAGTLVAAAVMVFWIVVPYLLSVRRFKKKDL